MSNAWDKPEEHDHVVVVADADAQRREAIRACLESAPGRDRAEQLGSYPRYRVRDAHDCDEALRLVSPEVTALVLNPATPRRDCVKLIEEMRPRRPDLAVVCYTTATPRAEAMAALLAGADHFLEYEDGPAIENALDLAVDRRWLSLLIERSAADIEEARQRLARLRGNSSVVLPGLRPPAGANAILPFHEAVRRYLAACARLFEGDPRGLADRLGVSYFALRRLLKRYQAPFPGRTQRARTRRSTTGKR